MSVLKRRAYWHYVGQHPQEVLEEVARMKRDDRGNEHLYARIAGYLEGWLQCLHAMEVLAMTCSTCGSHFETRVDLDVKEPPDAIVRVAEGLCPPCRDERFNALRQAQP